MNTRKCVTGWLVGVGLMLTCAAQASEPRMYREEGAGPGPRSRLGDPPAAHLRALTYRSRADTAWFGGYDVASGTAVAGGVWDFEDGSEQGWSSVDLTELPNTFRHLTADSCLAHGDPVCAVLNGTGSMWAGEHEDEATLQCWPGGMGYGNGWGMHAFRTFVYGGTGSVTLSFDYFVDTETAFDFVYVYVINENGVTSPALNTSANPNEVGVGYSGSVVEGSSIGSPVAPAHETIIVDVAYLPEAAGEQFEVDVAFDSDPYVSDQLDAYGQFLNSVHGAFGFDDFRALGVGLNDMSDFEPAGGPPTDGWVTLADAAIGSSFQVVHLDDLDPVGNSCQCPLTTGDNTHVMVAVDLTGIGFPHPKKQHEMLSSPAIYTGPGSVAFGLNDRFIRYDVWADLPAQNGVGYRTTAHYYPWTCPETGVVGWTVDPAGDFEFLVTVLGGEICGTLIENVSAYLPQAEIDSIRVTFELMGDCDDFNQEDCTGPEQTNQSPYWDNIRFGFASAPNAPPLEMEIRLQDGYPQTNTLLPHATGDILGTFDTNYADDDQTNADLADSLVVNAGTGPGTEVRLNFRVHPGPLMDRQSGWFTRYGSSALAPSWARARMDTAESSTGVGHGQYASYVHEDDPAFIAPERVGERPNPVNKILPDGFFTPGTTIEYFISSSFTGNPETRLLPDTTGGFFLEVEILPGYFQIDDGVLAPCLLYVDAFNAGAQVPIEDYGLRPYLQQRVDDFGLVHDAWDRYDYHRASSNTPAPLARETRGNNGMTKFQSMIYRTIFYNTGSFGQEGLRDGDADLLINFLTNNDFDRQALQKGLWLSGNGIATILDNPNRPISTALLATYAGARLGCSGAPYREAGCGGAGGAGDSTLCVRVDPSTPRHFPAQGSGYASLWGNGCPTLLAFRVVEPLPGNDSARGNLVYVDQDAGEAVTSCASVSHDRFGAGANYGVLLDAFSLHYLRRTPDGWGGSDCGHDTSAIEQRVADVFACMGVSDVCDPIIVSTPEPTPPPVRTRLLGSAPNPFNPLTTIRYVVGERSRVSLQVFDVSGKRVRDLLDAVQEPDRYAITWDGTSDRGTELGSGVFWVRMQTGHGFQGTTKVVLLR